jgi:hypothetical protein
MIRMRYGGIAYSSNDPIRRKRMVFFISDLLLKAKLSSQA